jgi:hypothetical protein
VEVITRETNWYAKKFLGNTPYLKLRSRTHHWKETKQKLNNEVSGILSTTRAASESR